MADPVADGSSTFDRLDVAVGRAVDEALASLEAGDVGHALEAIERGVKVSESHPSFAKRASSEFHRLESLLRLCVRVLESAGQPIADAHAVLGRIRALKQSTIH